MMSPSTMLPSCWPSGVEGRTLLCVRVQCKAGHLFNVLFGKSELQEQLHKQRNDMDLVETPWMTSKDALPAAQYTWDVSPAEPRSGPGELHRYRKVRFKSPPAAMASTPFNNEEMFTIVEYRPGQVYVVDSVSCTSAPYGDKFHVFFRYAVRAESASSSTLHLTFHVEFLPSMNRMLKPVVAKAVDGGVRGTFKMYRSVLGALEPSTQDIKESDLPAADGAAHEHREEEAEQPAAPAAVAAAAPVALPLAPEMAAAGFPGPPWLSALTAALVQRDQVALLSDLVGVGLRSVTQYTSAAQLLAIAVTVWLISLVMSALRAYQAACAAGGPLLMLLCWPLRVVDLPDSTSEVLTSLGLVAGINWAIIQASQALVRYLQQQQAVPSAKPSGVSGAPRAALPVAAPSAPPAGSNGDVATSQPASAAAAASSNAAKPAAASPPPAAASKPSKQKPPRAAPPPKPFPATQLAQLELRDMGQGGGGSGGGSDGANGTAAVAGAAASSNRGSNAGGGPAMTVSGSGTVTSPTNGSPPMAMADAWALEMPGLMGEGTAGVISPDAAPSTTSSNGRGLSPERPSSRPGDGTSGGAKQQSAGGGGAGGAGGFGTMFSKEGMDSMAETFKAAFRWDSRPEGAEGAAAEGVPRHAVQNPSNMSMSRHGDANSTARSPSHSQPSRSSSTYMTAATGLQADDPECATVVVEEIFENERFQPFRGWGHMWPGHFLPSDRVGHWSDRQGKPGGTASMTFELIAPSLPRGWKWLEPEWQVDMEGGEHEAVDEGGWSYALDFYLLKYPPQPGTGKCSIKHFVRRRRLTRTRVRIEPLDGPLPGHMNPGADIDVDYFSAGRETSLSMSELPTEDAVAARAAAAAAAAVRDDGQPAGAAMDDDTAHMVSLLGGAAAAAAAELAALVDAAVDAVALQPGVPDDDATVLTPSFASVPQPIDRRLEAARAASLSRSPSAPTPALPAAAAAPAAGGRGAGTSADGQGADGSVGAAALGMPPSTPLPGLSVAVAAAQSAAEGPRHEDFVLSPTYQVDADDPLGALSPPAPSARHSANGDDADDDPPSAPAAAAAAAPVALAVRLEEAAQQDAAAPPKPSTALKRPPAREARSSASTGDAGPPPQAAIPAAAATQSSIAGRAGAGPAQSAAAAGAAAATPAPAPVATPASAVASAPAVAGTAMEQLQSSAAVQAGEQLLPEPRVSGSGSGDQAAAASLSRRGSSVRPMRSSNPGMLSAAGLQPPAAAVLAPPPPAAEGGVQPVAAASPPREGTRPSGAGAADVGAAAASAPVVTAAAAASRRPQRDRSESDDDGESVL